MPTFSNTHQSSAHFDNRDGESGDRVGGLVQKEQVLKKVCVPPISSRRALEASRGHLEARQKLLQGTFEPGSLMLASLRARGFAVRTISPAVQAALVPALQSWGTRTEFRFPPVVEDPPPLSAWPKEYQRGCQCHPILLRPTSRTPCTSPVL